MWLGAIVAGDPRPAGAQDPGPRGPSLETLLAEARAGNKAVRSQAIQKLGRLRDRKAVPLLVELLEDSDSQVRVLALEALAAIQDPACLSAFLERFRDSQPVVVATAAREVARFEPAAAIPALLKAMRHRTAGVRDQAARAFERRTGFETRYDPDGPVDEREQVITRWEAWWESARGSMPAQWWIRGLAAEDERMRANSAMALRDSRNREAIPALVRALLDPAESVRLHAGIALSAITGLTFGYRPFVGAGGDAAERDRGAEAWRAWWERSKDAPEAEWYLAALQDARPENRASAAARLGELRYEPAAAALLDALGHDSATVREQAFRALVAITGVEIPFAPAAPEADRAAQAAEWRAWWGQNRAQGRPERLIDALLNGRHPVTRASAARSLAALPARRTVEMLLLALADPVPGVRDAAFSSLKKITGKSFEYAAEAGDSERKAAIARWQRWWQDEGRSQDWR